MHIYLYTTIVFINFVIKSRILSPNKPKIERLNRFEKY